MNETLFEALSARRCRERTLAPHVAAFAEWLTTRGYTPNTIRVLVSGRGSQPSRFRRSTPARLPTQRRLRRSHVAAGTARRALAFKVGSVQRLRWAGAARAAAIFSCMDRQRAHAQGRLGR
jgi:hypothetical protein